MNIIKINSSETNIELPPVISLKPLLIIAKKTIRYDIFSIKKMLFSILMIILFPLILILTVNLDDIPDLSIPISGILGLGFTMFFYSFSLMFSIIIGYTGSFLMAEEIKSGTMSILVSEPISRTNIIVGKLIGLFIFGITISTISLFIICICALRINNIGIIQFFIINFIYSLILLVFYGFLSIAISCIVRKPRNALIFPLFLAIIILLVPFIIKFISWKAYEIFDLYHFDISYQLANIYWWLLETLDPNSLNELRPIFTIMSLFKVNREIIDYSEYIVYYTNSNFYLPVVSLIYIMSIGIILIPLGILRFKKRDI